MCSLSLALGTAGGVGGFRDSAGPLPSGSPLTPRTCPKGKVELSEDSELSLEGTFEHFIENKITLNTCGMPIETQPYMLHSC